LFVDGELISVVDGRAVTVARWPSATAPYEPPVMVPGGFVGLSEDGFDRRLWFVARQGSRMLAGPPLTQGFAVSAAGRSVVVGSADLSKLAGSTHLLMFGGRDFRQLQAEAILRNKKGAATAVLGDDVLVQYGDGAVVGVMRWNTVSGSITPLRGYTDAGPVSPSTGRVVLSRDDGGCWSVAVWSRVPSSHRGRDRCDPRDPSFSPDGALLAGVSGRVDTGMSGGRNNRVVVLDASDGGVVFTSSPIAGAYQVAWERPSELLVLSRDGRHTVVVSRCAVDRQTCQPVWSTHDGGERYGTWLVVPPPGTRPIANY
jgi:hypothetical protein